MAPRPADFQPVDLHVRQARFQARVVHLRGPVATLSLPRGLPAAARPLPADAELSFLHEGQLVMLAGTLLGGDDVSARFRVDDGIAPRELRGFVRLTVALPVVVTPTGGAPLAMRTVDISAGGVLVEREDLAGEVLVELELPAGLGAVSARGRVVRSGRGGSAVRFEAIDPAQQARLDEFVVGVRHQLARRFAAAR